LEAKVGMAEHTQDFQQLTGKRNVGNSNTHTTHIK